jgi:cytochrome c-type biogenesis protein CcmH
LLGVLAAVGLPLLRRARSLPERGAFDRLVYRDQLREVERDVGRGVLNEAEASSARLEIQRRLLAVDATEGTRHKGSIRSPIMAVLASAFILLGGGAVYWRLGAPTLPDVPHADQAAAQPASPPSAQAPTAPPHVDMKVAAERLAQKLEADPSNAEGWELYARTVSMLGDWPKAKQAYQRALDLGRKSADTYAGYGEMLVLADEGIVSASARDAFVSALAVDPKGEVPRYYMALADSQAGDVREAIDAWLALAADIPDDSPMREEITRRVAEAARSGGLPAPALPKGRPAEAVTPNGTGPTEEQMAAAADMAPADREKMVAGMIAQLETKLQSAPDDLDGWLRLGRAYAVQGKDDKSADAFDHAIKLKPTDADIKLQAVGALLSRLQSSDPLPPRAITLLRQVASVSPDAPEVLWYLGVAAAREGRPSEARQDWTKLLTQLSQGGDDYKMVQAAIGQLPAP